MINILIIDISKHMSLTDSDLNKLVDFREKQHIRHTFLFAEYCYDYTNHTLTMHISFTLVSRRRAAPLPLFCTDR